MGQRHFCRSLSSSLLCGEPEAEAFGKSIHRVESSNAGNRYFSCRCCRLLLLFNYSSLLSSPACYCWELLHALRARADRATVTEEAVAAVCELCRVLTVFSSILLSKFVSDSPPARTKPAPIT